MKAGFFRRLIETPYADAESGRDGGTQARAHKGVPAQALRTVTIPHEISRAREIPRHFPTPAFTGLRF
jgi:hypothetical protein